MDAFFIFVATYLVWLPVAILGIYFVIQPRQAWVRLALFAIPTGILAYLFGWLGSLVFFDPRPFVAGHFTPLIPHAPDNGFPSDHTLLASSFASVGMFWNRWLGWALWLLTILIAVSRVYVGVHHPLDVIASMFFALLAAILWRSVLSAWFSKVLS